MEVPVKDGSISDVPRSRLNPDFPEIEGEFVYKDCQFASWTTLESIQHIENEFQFFEDDLLLATFPKSGTTLMQEILWLLYNNADINAAKKEKVYVRVPFIEENYTYVFPGDSREICPIEYLPRLPPPRLMKTHLPFRCIGQCLERTPGMKVVLVLRNPKDTAVSYYHFYRGTVDYGPYRGSWADFFEMWMSGWIASGDWFSVVTEWWFAAKQMSDRVHVVFYEDLLSNPDEEIHKVASFIGRPCDDKTVRIISEHVKFDNMSKNSAVNYSGVEGFTPDFRFMRKGQVGDWKNWFTVAQNEEFERSYAPRLREVGIKFRYE